MGRKPFIKHESEGNKIDIDLAYSLISAFRDEAEHLRKKLNDKEKELKDTKHLLDTLLKPAGWSQQNSKS